MVNDAAESVEKKMKKRELIDALLEDLKRIRDIGYNSEAHRATETVLACIRISEDAIRMAERELHAAVA